jgi:hypothetical protein
MAKKVFFSFHYQDVIDFRANVVRNHWLTKPDRQEAGFFDSSIWENAKKTGVSALKKLINDGLQNTSNTCVLVGTETFERRWVAYEIMKSFEKGNHIFCVHINSIKGKDGKIKSLGSNPLYYLGFSFSADGKAISLHEYIDNKWIKYLDLEGWNVKEVEQKYRGIVYRLSSEYDIFDWVNDDGYNKFSNWVQ